jgi:TonB family protein
LGGDEQVERYSNYADFQAYRYPRKLELDAKGRKIIIATVTGLTMSAFDRALLVPPDGAIERRHCKDMTTPVAISTPEPQYPPSASLSRIMADNSVNFTIETDGSVSHVHLLRGSIQPMDDATLEAVRGWRFKPAMCGTEPVVSDLTVSVSFRLR